MKTYGAKFHDYEVAIKNQASWKYLTPRQRAEQMGRYAEGLQYDEIKAAKKAKGKKFAKAIAEQRKHYEKPAVFGPNTSSITPANGTCTAAIPTNHAAREAQLQSVFGLPSAEPTFNTSYSPNQSGYYTTVTPENHAARQADLDDVFGLKPARPTFQQGSGITPAEGTCSAIIPENHAARQADLDAVFGQKQNTTGPKTWQKYYDTHGGKNWTSGKYEAPKFQTGSGITPAEGTLNVGRTTDPVLQGMGDNYRFLEERSNYKRALGEHLHKPTNISADMIDKKFGIGEVSPQTEFYRALEESQNANKFKLGKWGKIGLIAVGVAAVVGLGIWAYKKIKNKKEEEKLQEQQQQQQQIEETPVENTTVTETETTKPPVAEELTEETVVVPPVVEETIEETVVIPPVVEETTEEVAPETEETTEADKVESGKDGDIEIKVDGESYKVKKGDNVWNIAKGILREELGREATNAEIQIRTREIMKDNNLKLEADGYVCIIHPEQELKVA